MKGFKNFDEILWPEFLDAWESARKKFQESFFLYDMKAGEFLNLFVTLSKLSADDPRRKSLLVERESLLAEKAKLQEAIDEVKEKIWTPPTN